MIRIGTRESKLAVWQAEQVQQQLAAHGFAAELVYIKSEGDIDLTTPLYAMGVQGVFTRSLDVALLNGRIDVAVHSMKDVPTQLPVGITQAAILPRGPVNDLIVFKNELTQNIYNNFDAAENSIDVTENDFTIATSSIRRKAQWLHRFGHHEVCNLRGNVITRLQKLQTEPWDAAIFAQAGLERIQVRPATSEVLNWMLPAPAQGAIMIVCRTADEPVKEATTLLNDSNTAICTKIERDFLRSLMGGCSTPISALATINDNSIQFKGNIFSTNGKEKAEVEKKFSLNEFENAGTVAANELLQNGGEAIAAAIRNAK
ncbi:MAG: hydroxymethylbilane synthase [Bacteroidota bacterium]